MRSTWQGPGKTAAWLSALGDSITDGTASTMNGDDRWPDVLLQRLHAQVYFYHIAVVDAGIGGNQVIGPAQLLAVAADPRRPFGARPFGPRCSQPVRSDLGDLARGHQRLQQERQRHRRTR